MPLALPGTGRQAWWSAEDWEPTHPAARLHPAQLTGGGRPAFCPPAWARQLILTAGVTQGDLWPPPSSRAGRAGEGGGRPAPPPPPPPRSDGAHLRLQEAAVGGVGCASPLALLAFALDLCKAHTVAAGSLLPREPARLLPKPSRHRPLLPHRLRLCGTHAHRGRSRWGQQVSRPPRWGRSAGLRLEGGSAGRWQHSEPKCPLSAPCPSGLAWAVSLGSLRTTGAHRSDADRAGPRSEAQGCWGTGVPENPDMKPPRGLVWRVPPQ